MSLRVALKDIGATSAICILQLGTRRLRSSSELFYLLFALRHSLDARLADTLVSLTLWTVAHRSWSTASPPSPDAPLSGTAKEAAADLTHGERGILEPLVEQPASAPR